jgi:hypothetical protein
MRNITYFTGMDGASKGRETKPIRFSAIHDLPNIKSDSPSNQCRMDGKERLPVLLKDELQSDGALLDGFHNRTGL